MPIENSHSPKMRSKRPREAALIDDNTSIADLLKTKEGFSAFKEGIFERLDFYFSHPKLNFGDELKNKIRNKLTDACLNQAMQNEGYQNKILTFDDLSCFDREINRDFYFTTKGKEYFTSWTMKATAKYLMSPSCVNREELLTNDGLNNFEIRNLKSRLGRIKKDAHETLSDQQWFPQSRPHSSTKAPFDTVAVVKEAFLPPALRQNLRSATFFTVAVPLSENHASNPRSRELTAYYQAMQK